MNREFLRLPEMTAAWDTKHIPLAPCLVALLTAPTPTTASRRLDGPGVPVTFTSMANGLT